MGLFHSSLSKEEHRGSLFSDEPSYKVLVVTKIRSTITHHWNVNSTEQKPCLEAKIFPSSQGLPRIFLNQDVHCRVHKIPSFISIQIQINPF